MADFQEDGDRKLQIFAYLHIGITTLSITIGLYSWYCFIYQNKNFACQWHFKNLTSQEVKGQMSIVTQLPDVSTTILSYLP